MSVRANWAFWIVTKLCMGFFPGVHKWIYTSTKSTFHLGTQSLIDLGCNFVEIKTKTKLICICSQSHKKLVHSVTQKHFPLFNQHKSSHLVQCRTFRDIASTEGIGSQDKKKNYITKLLVASTGNEPSFIMRALQVSFYHLIKSWLTRYFSCVGFVSQ